MRETKIVAVETIVKKIEFRTYTYEIKTTEDGRMWVTLVKCNDYHQFRTMPVESRDEAMAVIKAWEDGTNARLATRAGREYTKSLFR
jgi:hypothetical protein